LHIDEALFDSVAIGFVSGAMGSLMLNRAVWHYFAGRAEADPVILAADATSRGKIDFLLRRHLKSVEATVRYLDEGFDKEKMMSERYGVMSLMKHDFQLRCV
jgi:hypothetical protein